MASLNKSNLSKVKKQLLNKNIKTGGPLKFNPDASNKIFQLCKTGKKTFLLLPLVSEWRWQENRSDTPWYASVRIFRQSEKFNWETVIGNVENELSLH